MMLFARNIITANHPHRSYICNRFCSAN